MLLVVGGQVSDGRPATLIVCSGQRPGLHPVLHYRLRMEWSRCNNSVIRCNYVLWTIPNITELLTPLEEAI